MQAAILSPQKIEEEPRNIYVLVIQRILDFIDSYIVYCYTHSICQSPVIGGCKIFRHPFPCIDPFACIHEMTIMRNRKSGIYSSIICSCHFSCFLLSNVTFLGRVRAVSNIICHQIIGLLFLSIVLMSSFYLS